MEAGRTSDSEGGCRTEAIEPGKPARRQRQVAEAAAVDLV